MAQKRKDLVAGYTPFLAPQDGLGPFKEIFDYSMVVSSISDFNLMDALILYGGADISTKLYNPDIVGNYTGPLHLNHRDELEWECIGQAIKHKIPIIGVCRGAQMVCAYAGGQLLQDVSDHSHGVHEVQTFDGKTMETNSIHHQMMYPFEIEHKLLAWTNNHAKKIEPAKSKYVIQFNTMKLPEPEAVYFPTINAIGVQGHPEWLPKDHPYTKWFLEQIVEYCFSKEKANVC